MTGFAILQIGDLVIVNSYYPTYRFYGGEKAYYNRMRNAVEAYFEEFPNFK